MVLNVNCENSLLMFVFFSVDRKVEYEWKMARVLWEIEWEDIIHKGHESSVSALTTSMYSVSYLVTIILHILPFVDIFCGRHMEMKMKIVCL